MGLGTSYIANATEKDAVETIQKAYEGGVNDYDLTRNGDSMSVEHYRNLANHAEDCVQCGHCNHRCPFHVDQMTRMRKIGNYFADTPGRS